MTLLDCPINGTGAQARNKDIAVYGSGGQAAFERSRPVLRGFARDHYYLGEFGNGSRMKYIANLLVAVHNVAAAEALALGAAAGLDEATVLEVIQAGAGTSRMLEIRGPMMVEMRFLPATNAMRRASQGMKLSARMAPKAAFAKARRSNRMSVKSSPNSQASSGAKELLTAMNSTNVARASRSSAAARPPRKRISSARSRKFGTNFPIAPSSVSLGSCNLPCPPTTIAEISARPRACQLRLHSPDTLYLFWCKQMRRRR